MNRQLNATVREAAATTHFHFVSDGTPAGAQAVATMRVVAEQDYAAAKAIFNLGDVPGLPFVVTVDPSAGGAWHQTCADTGIHLIPEDAPSLLVAETTECFMALSRTWDCGQTNGEGLSRALAMAIRPFAVLTGLDGDVAGWWSSGPRDYVNDNSAADQDQMSNACGTLFVFYLRSQLGFGWVEIVAAGGPTLGDTYHKLTGKPGKQGFADFVSALRPLAKNGNLAIPASGNPFPVGAPTPAPAPSPTPTPTPVPAPPPPPSQPPTPCADDESAWWEWLEGQLFPHLDTHYPGWSNREP